MNDDKEFHKYVYWLGESIPDYMQEEARSYFMEYCEDKDIPYIISTSNPFTWGNAIAIMKKMGYPKNKMAINRIMYLFQDINWQFVDTAIYVVEEIYSHEPDIVISAIEKAAKLAHRYMDTDWLFGLSWVKEHLGISKNDFNDSETINILYKSGYWDDRCEIM